MKELYKYFQICKYAFLMWLFFSMKKSYREYFGFICMPFKCDYFFSMNGGDGNI